jgi:uncharacterized membrane protein (Fun14 family)
MMGVYMVSLSLFNTSGIVMIRWESTSTSQYNGTVWWLMDVDG